MEVEYVNEKKIIASENMPFEMKKDNSKSVKIQLEVNSYDKRGLHDWIFAQIKSKLKRGNEDNSIGIQIINKVPDSAPEELCLTVSKIKFLRKRVVSALNSKLLSNQSFFIADLIFKREDNNKLEISIDLEGVIFTRIINHFFEKYEMQMKYGDLLKSIILISNDAISEEVKWEIIKKVLEDLQLELCRIAGEMVESKLGVNMEVGCIRIL